MYQTYRIFTDGSAIGNPGPGGWGVVLIYGPKRWELSGASPWTTISEMELAAAIQALRTLPDRAQIDLRSDSEYLIYGMRTFVFRWQRQGWRNRRGVRLRHRYLWAELLELDARLRVRWTGSKAITVTATRFGPTPWRIRPPALCGYGRRPRHKHRSKLHNSEGENGGV